MPVPGFLLRSLERQLSAADITAQLGSTHFDPTGQIVIEDLRLSLRGFPEPVAQIRSLYIRLDPLSLLARHFKAEQLRASDISLWIPAMLSASGTREPLIDNAQLWLNTDGHALEIAQFNARGGSETLLREVSIFIQGELDTLPLIKADSPGFPAAQLFARYYPQLCRRLGELSPKIGELRDAQLHLHLTPSPTAGATAHATVSARSYHTPDHAVQLGTFSLETAFPLRSDTPTPVALALRLATLDAATPHGPARARHLSGTLQAELDTQHLRLTPQLATLAAPQLALSALSAHDATLRASLDTWPQLRADAVLRIDSAPLSLSAQFDLFEKSGSIHARGSLGPAVLDGISQWTQRDITAFVRLHSPAEIDLTAHFADGHFTAAQGRFAAHQVFANGLTLDTIGGHIHFADHLFQAPLAYAKIGTNYAHGSYRHDLATRDYRFLLNGQLNPPDIAPWFREWWSTFWQKITFPQAAPTASVDVRGRWRAPEHSRVFVAAEAHNPTIEGAPLDHVQTRLYLKPDYYDALEVHVRRSTQSAHGRFLRLNDPLTKQLARQDFTFSSTLDLPTILALSGPELATAIAPFQFAEPIALEAAGYIAAHGARHFTLQGRTNSDFSFYDFPLNGLTFSALIADDTLRVDTLSVGLADGLLSGRLHLQNLGSPAPQLGFDLSLAQGKFYKWTALLSDFLAHRRGETPPPHDEKNHNVTIDLDVSAEGNARDPLSFIGSGNMELKGRGLGQIQLFGLLSELLSFTALNFNQLLSSFTIEREKLVFPEVNITGSNSAITASGHYAMDGGGLNFRARVNPFGESKFILKSLVGLILTPVSNVLEVRLTGPIDKPKWSFLHFSNAPDQQRVILAPATEADEAAAPPETQEATGNSEQPRNADDASSETTNERETKANATPPLRAPATAPPSPTAAPTDTEPPATAAAPPAATPAPEAPASQ